MKKQFKFLLAIVLATVMCLTSLPVFASANENGISPRLSNMGTGAFSFSALEGGGYVDISYEAYEDTFMLARVTVTLQKRFLLVIWNDIDTWTATNTDLWGDFYHVFQLEGKGTYRANMTLEVFGIDGTVDVIEDSITSKY